jgi:hypothetical protein
VSQCQIVLHGMPDRTQRNFRKKKQPQSVSVPRTNAELLAQFVQTRADTNRAVMTVRTRDSVLGFFFQIHIYCKLQMCLRMVSSGLLRRVALVRTDVSEEPGASFIRVTKIKNNE